MIPSGPRDVISARHAAHQLIRAFLVFEALLVILDLLFNVYDVAGDISIRRIFNPAREESLPTWFSAMQALVVGCVAYLIAAARRRQGRSMVGWILVGTFFVYLSADDSAAIHERLGSAIERALGAQDLPTYAWQIFIAPVLALALLASAAYAWRHVQPRLRPLIIAGLACFAISQGLDFVEGMEKIVDTIDALGDTYASNAYLISHAPRLLEEWLEMLGTTAFLAAFLNAFVDKVDGVRLELRAS